MFQLLYLIIVIIPCSVKEYHDFRNMAEAEGNALAFPLVSNIDLLCCSLQRGDSATAIQYLGNNL